MKTENVAASIGYCPYCLKLSSLCMSHAIPRAAFKTLFAGGNGNAIAIPNGKSNVHLTSDSGAGLLLCQACEGLFNRSFDGPMTNALKELDTAIVTQGFRSQVTFEANQLAHAVVATAWRICLSPAHMYSECTISDAHKRELDNLLRRPTGEILRNCSVKVSRLSDSTSEEVGGFGQNLMRQFIKTPEVYSIRTKRNGKPDRFAMDWTMFGFLIHLILPRLPYPKSQKFRGLKLDATKIAANPIDIFNYPPLRVALIEGYAAQQQNRITPSLRNRMTKGRMGSQ
jgi:hypothetical protein